MGRSADRATPAFSLALFALMLGCILWLTALGAGLYGQLAASRTANDQARATLRYLVTRVREADAAGAVTVRQEGEGEVLVLADADTGYETRIFLSEGWLVEQLCPAGAALDPAAAQPVAQAEAFSAQWARPGLLTLSAGGAEAQVALRSAEGGAA